MSATTIPVYQSYNRSHYSHGLRDTAGHVVVRTRLHATATTTEVLAEDVSEFFVATDYGQAVARKNELIPSAAAGEYYVVDTVYTDGCRSYVNGRAV